jgi:integrase
MCVPKDLQSVLKRTELKKSLKTKNKSAALRLCRTYIANAEKLFEKLRLDLATTDDAFEFVDEKNNVSHRNGHCEQSLQPSVAEPQPIKQCISLRELITLYVSEIISQRGELIAKGIEKNLLRFMEIVTDKPLDQYTVEDKLRYRDILQQLPKCIDQKKYRGMSIEEIAQLKKLPDELLSVKTVNMRLIDAATLFNWAVANSIITNHPFKRAVLKIQKSEDSERPAVADDDIRTIIEKLPMSKAEPSAYWIPLIASFTGMRQSEIAQLDGDDIVNIDGTWCIDVNDRGDKRLKNPNAKRIVPLHPTLIKAGLVEFSKTRNGLKLFEDVKPYLGKYGHQVSKDFAKFLRRIDLDKDGQTFHGLRHSVITKLWSAGIPEAHTAAIVGHKRGDRESYTRYAKKTDLRPLLHAIESICYGDINVTAWSKK